MLTHFIIQYQKVTYHQKSLQCQKSTKLTLVYTVFQTSDFQHQVHCLFLRITIVNLSFFQVKVMFCEKECLVQLTIQTIPPVLSLKTTILLKHAKVFFEDY